jgi:LPS O-antigen subunit length determinant protein (WzzB/FepE family)
MSIQTPSEYYNTLCQAEISLRDIISVVLKSKIVIVFTSILFAIGFGIYIYNQPNIYKSEVLTVTAKQEQHSGIGDLAGKLGGFAGMAGISLPQQTDNTEIILVTLKSKKFVMNLIEKHNLYPELIAATNWQAQQNKLIYNPELYNEKTGEWVRKVNFPKQKKPSGQEAYEKFMKVFSVKKSVENGTIILSVEHLSPVRAKEWLDLIINDLNQEMRSTDVEEAQKNITYLKALLNQPEYVAMREVLYGLLEEQVKTIMLSKVRDNYALKVIDPALVPEMREKPRRIIFILVGALLGMVLSVFVTLTRYFYKNS